MDMAQCLSLRVLGVVQQTAKRIECHSQMLGIQIRQMRRGQLLEQGILPILCIAVFVWNR